MDDHYWMKEAEKLRVRMLTQEFNSGIMTNLSPMTEFLQQECLQNWIPQNFM